MAVTAGGTAPYAPTSAIVQFLERNRNGTMPSPVTLGTLDRLGISESLQPRVLQALKLLDFVDADGNLSPTVAELRKLPTPDYLPQLANLLRIAYADVFEHIDPSHATYEQVRDAFRGFRPDSLRDRMVALFLGLLSYTDEWDDLPSARSLKLRKAPPRTSTGVKALRKPTSPVSSVTENGPKLKPAPMPAEFSRTVDLPGNIGTVTVSTDVNPMKLKGSVRESFYKLVDMLDEFEPEAPDSQLCDGDDDGETGGAL